MRKLDTHRSLVLVRLTNIYSELEAKLIAGLNKRALASPDQFADQDAKDA